MPFSDMELHNTSPTGNHPHQDFDEIYQALRPYLGHIGDTLPLQVQALTSSNSTIRKFRSQLQYLYFHNNDGLQELIHEVKNLDLGRDQIYRSIIDLSSKTFRVKNGKDLVRSLRAASIQDQQIGDTSRFLTESDSIDIRSATASAVDRDMDLSDPSRKRHLVEPSGALPRPASKRLKVMEDTANNPIPCDEETSSARIKEFKLMSHQLRDLPKTGFGIMPAMEYDQSFPLAWELTRAAQSGSLHVSAVKDIQDHDELLQSIRQQKLTKPNARFEHSARRAFDTENMLSGLTLSASIALNNKNVGPLFKTVLEPIKPDCSCRAQRKWGWHRLLYVKVSFRARPSHLESDEDLWKQRLVAWMMQPHQLVGRTWRAFHLEDVKNRSKTKQAEGHGMKRVVLFALDGLGLRPVSFEDFMDWLVPFKYNYGQVFCKAAARYDLALSRTRPSIVFEQRQIQIIKDAIPTTTLDEMPFQDARFKNMPRREHDPSEPMTDGCGIISVGAAIEVCKVLGISSRPAAFQARCFGSKGLWIISAAYDTADPRHLDIWIQIRESQLKVNHGIGTELDTKYRDDETLRSFDVNLTCLPARTSELHRDFLNILIDRGVQPQSIIQYVVENLEDETSTLVKACKDPEELILLLQRNKPADPPPRDSGRDVPKLFAEKLTYFVTQGGFLPTTCDYVAESYLRFCATIMLYDLMKMRIRCTESTVLFGVPDPTGLLRPGEIHVGFSKTLEKNDRSTGLTNLAGKQVLVARDPTIRGSDIQRYNCVWKTELSHLQNVVVFPITGNMPSAARHQGGDYDGDRFTLLWSSRIVDGFKNAPVPQAKSHQEFGVHKETVILGALAEECTWGSPAHCSAFLERAFLFRFQENMLGRVTNLFYLLTYNTKDIWVPAACDLADLHDLLVDSLKQGYRFDSSAMLAFKKASSIDERQLLEPLYKASIAKIEDLADSGRDLVAAIRGYCERNHGPARHILDEIHFNVKLRHVLDTIQKVTEVIQTDMRLDHQMLIPMEAFQDTSMSLTLQQKHGILSQIEQTLNEVEKCWVQGFGNRDTFARSVSLNEAKIDQAYERYRSMKPPQQIAWMHYEQGVVDCTSWERLCASVFYSNVYKRGNSRHRTVRLFSIAGKALCSIKRGSGEGRQVVDCMRSLQRYRRSNRTSKPSEAIQAASDAVEGDITAQLDNLALDDFEDDEFDMGDLMDDVS